VDQNLTRLGLRSESIGSERTCDNVNESAKEGTHTSAGQHYVHLLEWWNEIDSLHDKSYQAKKLQGSNSRVQAKATPHPHNQSIDRSITSCANARCQATATP